MRFLALLLLPCSLAFAGAPADVAQAVASFRPDGAKGWAFVQTTKTASESTVERYDPAKPVFTQWTLVKKDGHEPTQEDITTYMQMQSRASGGATAPTLANQLDTSQAVLVSESADTATYRCPVKPGESGDDIAEYLQATFTYHKPTRTITSVVIASQQPFSPQFGISITEMKTSMRYSIPGDGKPSLLQEVTSHVRGRAFMVKSLDADMTLTYSDYAKAGK